MNEIPTIGYGTWNREKEIAQTCTLSALEAGYRHLDCAEGYDNEEFVGRAIAEFGLPRNDYKTLLGKSTKTTFWS